MNFLRAPGIQIRLRKTTWLAGFLKLFWSSWTFALITTLTVENDWPGVLQAIT